MVGFGASWSHDQVLRNQAVGSTCSVAGVGAGVGDPHRHQQVGGLGLGVVDLDDPVAVVVEGARVEQLVLGVELAPPRVLGDQVVVGEGAPAGSGSATGSRRGWAPRRGTTSTP